MQKMLNDIIKQRKSTDSSKSSNESELNEAEIDDSTFR